MKKLSIVMCLALIMMAGQVMAQTYEVEVADTVVTSVALEPGEQVTFTVYLAGITTTQNNGGFLLDWSDQTTDALYISCTPAEVANGGPWQDGAGGQVVGTGTFTQLVGALGGAAPTGNRLEIGTCVMECNAPGIDVTVDVAVNPAVTMWAPLDQTTVTPSVFTLEQGGCSVAADCAANDGLWCTGTAECVAGACVVTGADPCDDANACTVDTCIEAATPGDTVPGTCEYACGATTSTDPCCEDPACAGFPLCEANVTLIKQSGFYAPVDGVVTIKNKICLDNPSDLVGGIQFDICDEPDCLTCIDCELTERTVMFDCVVLELPNGCCRVIMFCKNPGCAINPGLCDIVTVVMQTNDNPECGEDCIEEEITNIVVSDYDGFELAGAGIGGTLCPVVCGDVCPAGTGLANDCGDGVVDIYDIMCEVDLALTATTPNDCQAPRANVPTGTPPDCTAPNSVCTGGTADGDPADTVDDCDDCVAGGGVCSDTDPRTINILDIMVLIDMALNRQDCCSFFYQGIIY
jgi:hypothetical protein